VRSVGLFLLYTVQSNIVGDVVVTAGAGSYWTRESALSWVPCGWRGWAHVSVWDKTGKGEYEGSHLSAWLVGLREQARKKQHLFYL